MLKEAIDAYVDLRRSAGFKFVGQAGILRSFERFASDRGEKWVRVETAIEWAARASLRNRAARLDIVRAFAQRARLEDPRHEIPPPRVFGSPPPKRPVPYLFSTDEILRLMHLALETGPAASLRPYTIYTLIGLLASTGLRPGEALRLRIEDVEADRLVVRETKYRKTRLVPLAPSVRQALGRYLERREQFNCGSKHVFVSLRGRPLKVADASMAFRGLLRKLGIEHARRGSRPRLTDLRHTWTVRALETCPDRSRVPIHTRAVFTYLGHASVASTYWYLHSTPRIMAGIADACLAQEGGAPS